MTFYIKQGDTSPGLQYLLTDAGGNPIALSGATVTFWMSAVPHTDPLVAGGAVDVIDPATGFVEYVWQAGDTANAGRFKGEFRITFANGKKISAPNHGYMDIFIESELA